jgi:hypothetical protein
MLGNKHYIGMVVFGSHRTEKSVVNGQVISRKSRPTTPEETIIAKGKHPAIVPLDLFDAAQAKMNKNPRSKIDAPLQNPLAGLAMCFYCGKTLAQHPYPHAETRIECRNRGGCNANSAKLREVVDAVAFALEHEQLPELEAKLRNDEGKAASIHKKQLDKMHQELEELYAKEERQHDFLESGTYTEDVFIKRNKVVHAQIEDLKSKIFEAKQNIPKEINYEEKIIQLKAAIEGLRNDDLSAEEKNRLLKAIIERIDYEFLAREGKGKTKFRLHIKLLL